MRLKKIKFAGFKSFVDPTTIDINGNLVGIVGPNGCGKSNVIDAVRWVLGESSAKQLRGENMQDVIFSGSTQRKPVARASVELIFDNSAKLLSGMFGRFDEVAVKRVLVRSGDSSYYINNQLVRRRDITELFLGTGVGSKGYAVIEQGMISRIIDARPEELRLYLEEAAAVSKYRERRRETITKLADTQENLVRISDMNRELEKQIDVLQLQAQEAHKYQQLQRKLHAQQLVLHQTRLANADGALHKIAQQMAELNNTLTTLNQTIQVNEDELQQQYNYKHKQDSQLASLVDNFNNTRTLVARLEERLQQSKHLHARLTQEQQKLVDEQTELQHTCSELEQQNSALKQQLQLTATRAADYEHTYEQALTIFTQHEANYQQQLASVNNLQQQIKTAQHQRELLHNSQQHKKQQLANLATRIKRLDAEKSENLLDFNENYTQMQQEVADLELELSQINETLTQIVVVKRELTEQITKTHAELTKLNLEINTLESKSSLYNEQLKQYASGELTKDTELDNAHSLWQQIEVVEGYELAVEVALKDILNAVKVKDCQQLMQQQLSRMLVLWHEFSAPQKIAATKLSDMQQLDACVSVKNKHFAAVGAILQHYVVVDNLHTAQSVINKLTSAYKIVTLDGHILTHHYAIMNAKSNITPLQHTTQIRQIEKQLHKLQQQKLSLENSLATAKNSLADYEQQLLMFNNQHKVATTKQRDLQLKLVKEEQIVLQNRAYQAKVEQEHSIVNQEITRLTEELASIVAQLTASQATIESLTQQSIKVEAHYANSTTDYNTAKEHLHKHKQTLEQLHLEHKLLMQQSQAHEVRLTEKTRQLKVIHEKIIHIEKEHNSIILDKDSQELETLNNQLVSLTEAINSARADLGKINEQIARIKSQLSSLNNQRNSCVNQSNQLELKQQEQLLLKQGQCEALANMAQQPDIVVESELKEYQSFTLEQLEKGIRQLNQQIASLGLVNLKAIQDLAEAQQRHGEVMARIADLTEAITILESAIKKIDSETRSILNDTYNKVNIAFSGYFTTLFGGGNANLVLTDSDILNAGLQVFASPPGKKNSSLQLLSGGEKALTAMSLIFAFFNLNPTSFCLLDEVDAPLDDANTARFCNLVQELAINTQFIYISHNRLAMEMANQLVGVTMQEKGVSTVVGVSLVDAVKHAV